MDVDNITPGDDESPYTQIRTTDLTLKEGDYINIGSNAMAELVKHPDAVWLVDKFIMETLLKKDIDLSNSPEFQDPNFFCTSIQKLLGYISLNYELGLNQDDQILRRYITEEDNEPLLYIGKQYGVDEILEFGVFVDQGESEGEVVVSLEMGNVYVYFFLKPDVEGGVSVKINIHKFGSKLMLNLQTLYPSWDIVSYIEEMGEFYLYVNNSDPADPVCYVPSQDYDLLIFYN